MIERIFVKQFIHDDKSAEKVSIHRSEWESLILNQAQERNNEFGAVVWEHGAHFEWKSNLFIKINKKSFIYLLNNKLIHKDKPVWFWRAKFDE